MGMVINTNVSSLTAQRHLSSSRAEMEKAMERLSSGLRINSAMDDAAGLTIAHSLDSKIASLSQAVRNANDGIALVQLAEGALDEVSAMLTRMKELATQSINGTYSSADRTNLDLEFQQLSAEITRISENTFFNGQSVINSTSSATFQVGDTSSDQISLAYQKMGSAHIGGTVTNDHSVTATTGVAATVTTYTFAGFDTGDANEPVAGDQFQITIEGRTFVQDFDTDVDTTMGALVSQISNSDLVNLNTVTWDDSGDTDFVIKSVANETLSISALVIYTKDSSGNITSQHIDDAANAQRALQHIDSAIADVDSYRATLGSVANRMQHSSNNLMSRVEHQSSARSRIQDADYAVESASLAKSQVLQQAGTAMLAQANASTQNILSLLK